MERPRLLMIGFVVLLFGQNVMSGYQPIRGSTLAVTFNGKLSVKIRIL